MWFRRYKAVSVLMTLVSVVVIGEGLRVALHCLSYVVDLHLTFPIEAQMRADVVNRDADEHVLAYWKKHPDRDPKILHKAQLLNPAPAGRASIYEPITKHAVPFYQLSDQEYLDAMKAIKKSDKKALERVGRMALNAKQILPAGSQFRLAIFEDIGGPDSPLKIASAIIVTVRNQNGTLAEGLIPEGEYWASRPPRPVDPDDQ